MRDDSGWKTEEPTPTRPAARRIVASVPATDNSIKPTRENAMPPTSEYGIGRRSVYIPTTGCSSEAVNCSVNAIKPTCE